MALKSKFDGKLQRMWIPYAVTAVVMVAMAVVGMRATQIGDWYRALIKPSWQPPDWVFGPVWTTIYICIIFSVGMVWNRSDSSFHSTIIFLVAVNIVLNMMWSVLFFTMRRPDWALIEVVFLWLSVLSLIVFFGSASPWSSLLLVPYIVWVTVAAYLTLTIVRLNKPFGG